MSNPFNEDDGTSNPDHSTLLGGLPGAQGFAGSQNASSERRLEERNSVITARGTAEGLVLRVDGRVETSDLISCVRDFVESRRSFLSGNDVAFEWIGKRPDDSVIQNLTNVLSSGSHRSRLGRQVSEFSPNSRQNR